MLNRECLKIFDMTWFKTSKISVLWPHNVACLSWQSLKREAYAGQNFFSID